MADWKIGDLAVCINAKPDRSDPMADLLVERKTYRVAVAGTRIDGVVAIGFLCHKASTTSVYGFSAYRFRKVKKASAKFTASIRACRDAHSPAPVA